MKNKSFLGGRLPVATHKGQGRPSALTGVQFAGPVDPDQKDNAEIDALGNVPDTAPTHAPTPKPTSQEASIPKRGNKSATVKQANSSTGGKRYYFTLPIERSILNRLEAVFEQNPNAKRGAVMRKLSTSFRAALVADGASSALQYSVNDPVTVPLDLRLPDDFVRAVKERDDPMDLEPTTTVLGRYIAPLYAKQLQSICKKAR